MTLLDPAELAEALHQTARTMSRHLEATRDRLIDHGLDPVRAVDPNGRPIMLDGLASLGQILAAAAQLDAARMPPALVDDLRDLVARARNRETAPPAVALVDDVEAILDEHGDRE